MNDQSEFSTCSAGSGDSRSPQRSPTLWPTPSSNKITESGELVFAEGCTKPHSATTGKPVQTALADAVKMWPTPQASDPEHAGPNQRDSSGRPALPAAVLHHSPMPRSSPSPAPSITATFPIRSALAPSRTSRVIRYLSDAVLSRMLSAGASHANRTHAPENDSHQQTTATSGENVGVFLGTFDPASRCLKTSAACLQASQDFFSTAYLATWPRFGTLVNGRLCRQAPLVLHTDETASGCSAGTSWPTASTRDYKGARSPEAQEASGRNPVTNNLCDCVELAYPGPPSPANGQADRESRSTGGSRQGLWLTPKVPSGGGQANRTTEGGGLRKIEDQTEARQGGKLNPHWVFALMGYPPLWAEIGRKSTTASRNSKPQVTP